MNKIVRLEPSSNHIAGLSFADMSSLEDKIIAAVKTVYDPEIPVDIYELGLIYKIEISGDNHVHIDMTLTAPACPVADILPAQVATVVRQIDEVNDVKVDLVFDPPWTPERMSEEAKLLLDMM
jgi:FeS assembly SUF system protein